MDHGWLDSSISLLTILSHPPPLRESIYTLLLLFKMKWTTFSFVVLETQVARLDILASPPFVFLFLGDISCQRCNVGWHISANVSSICILHFVRQLSTRFLLIKCHNLQWNVIIKKRISFLIQHTLVLCMHSIHKKVIFYWFPNMTYGAWIIPYFT